MVKESCDQYSEQETIKRRDGAPKRMLSTPLKPLRKKKAKKAKNER
jgi:hypothetical protein